MPRPVARPHPPIVIGGTTPPSLRRAVKRGNGWYGFNLDPPQTAKCLEGLRAAANEVERPASLGRLEITVTPPPMASFDLDLVRRYRDAGVDRVVPYPIVGSVDDMIAQVERAAADVIARL
jgi:alkanesulfonate monooxygenase SsuD/methylene tetrahydromethanopterin reductase-like flavin-dependent oxidoreductase (luciferase family)